MTQYNTDDITQYDVYNIMYYIKERARARGCGWERSWTGAPRTVAAPAAVAS